MSAVWTKDLPWVAVNAPDTWRIDDPQRYLQAYLPLAYVICLISAASRLCHDSWISSPPSASSVLTMKFTPTRLPDSYLIDLDTFTDERGSFARMFCANELRERGLATHFVQINASFTTAKGTLRGMHYQLPPRAETKLVRCIAGSIWDVILDLRTDSPTCGRWFGAELSAASRRMMYVPKGCAHGFITLADDCEVLYLVDEFYAPDLERGVRWDDPHFAIEWPARPTVISTKDQHYRDFAPDYHLVSLTEEDS